MSKNAQDHAPEKQGEVMEEKTFSIGMAASEPESGANQAMDESMLSASALAGGRGEVGRRALRQVFARLENILDAEVELLQQGQIHGLDEITQSKNQCLLDLTRLSRALNVEALMADSEGEAFKEEVLHIRAKIKDSEVKLKFYLDAAREVASMVAESVRVAESDGTYAESGPFGRYGR